MEREGRNRHRHHWFCLLTPPLLYRPSLALRCVLLATATRKGVKLYKPDLAQISNELERAQQNKRDGGRGSGLRR
jgi:hypothetical protein